MDRAGDLYIADASNHVVRRVDGATGIITTVAGTGTAGSSGDGGAATNATLTTPAAVAVDLSGNLLIADAASHVIRKVNIQTGNISTVAGSGTAAYSGDHASAQLNNPQGIALDATNILYIADTGNHVIREVNASTGVITTVAGAGTPGLSGAGGDPLAAKLSSPSGVAVDAAGNLIIADTGNQSIRQVFADRSSIINLFKTLTAPIAVSLDPSGVVYVAASGDIERSVGLAGAGGAFPPLPVGSVSTPTLINFSNSGNADLDISSIAFTGSNSGDFSQTNTCGATLAPGARCSLPYEFTPTAPGYRAATLGISSNSLVTSASISIWGIAVDALSLSPFTASSPNPTIVGQTSTFSTTLKNASTAPMSINSVAVSTSTPNTPPAFTQTNNCGAVLAPNASCQINVLFAPAVAENYFGTLAVSYGLNNIKIAAPLNVAADPVRTVDASPASLSFYPQAISSQWSSLAFAVNNDTLSTVTLSNPVITGPAAKDYSAFSSCGSSLASYATCYIYVYFNPSLLGTRSAVITLSDSVPGTHGVSLSGTGTLPDRFEIFNSATGKVLDIGDNSDGTVVRQSTLNGSQTQMWRAVSAGGDAYEIANAASGKALDVTGASPANGAPIQQYTYYGFGNQQWQLALVDDVHYKIVSRQTGKVLDVPSASTADGTPVQQWDFNGNPQQLWTLALAAPHYVTSTLSGKALTVTGNSTASGAPVQQSLYVGGQAQQWQFVPVGGGYYALINHFTGKALDVTGASSANGTPMQQCEYLGYPNQQWQIVPIDNEGNYKIVNRLTGKALDDTGYSKADGTPIQQWDYLGDVNQQWRILSVYDSLIINNQSNKVLDLPGGSPADGTPVQQWSLNGLGQQQWQIVKLPNQSVLIVNGLTGKLLEVTASSLDNGAAIQQAEYNGGDNQQWLLIGLANFPSFGPYEIVNKASGKTLDVSGSSSANGAVIQQYQFLNKLSQQWYIPGIY